MDSEMDYVEIEDFDDDYTGGSYSSSSYSSNKSFNDNYFKEEKSSPIRSFLGLLTFSTILPINVYTSIESMTKLTWLWPLIHFLIGGIAALIASFCLNTMHLNTFFVAVITYAFLMIITGYNHIDGLMDMSDGVMVHGSASKKLEVMKDSMVGAGGIMSTILIGLLTVAGLFNILEYNFLAGIIVCEMSSKTALLTTALISRPIEGIGSYFIKSINIMNFTISTVIVAILAFLVGGIPGIIGVLGAIVGGFAVSLVAVANFGVANGDVLGASNEVGRVISLLFMAVALFF